MVADVEFVLPRIVVFTAPPVAIDTAVAATSVEMPRAPVPELIAIAPLPAVTEIPPEPDCKVDTEAPLVEPRVNVLTPPPVAKFTVVAAASADMLIALVPEVIVTAPALTVNPLPAVSDVVVVKEPGAVIAAGKDKVTTAPDATVDTWFAVPAIWMLPTEGDAVPLSPVSVFRAPLPAVSSHVAVIAPAEAVSAVRV